MTSVIGVKHKSLLSDPDEMQVPAECLTSARRGRAAGLRVIFTYLYFAFPTYWLIDSPLYLCIKSLILNNDVGWFPEN